MSRSPAVLFEIENPASNVITLYKEWEIIKKCLDDNNTERNDVNALGLIFVYICSNNVTSCHGVKKDSVSTLPIKRM